MYVAVIAYILNSRFLWSKNLLLLLLIPICYITVLENYECQKFWKIGLDGEKFLISRLADRMEELNEFSYNKEYNLIYIGDYKSFNSSVKYKKADFTSHIMNETFVASWNSTALMYFMPEIKYKVVSFFNLGASSEDIKKAFAGIPQNIIASLKPWPNKSSVLLYNDTILVCWKQEELEYVKKALTEKK